MEMRLYHSRTREGVPAETNAIAFFNITPLLLQTLVIHGCGQLRDGLCLVVIDFSRRQLLL